MFNLPLNDSSTSKYQRTRERKSHSFINTSKVIAETDTHEERWPSNTGREALGPVTIADDSEQVACCQSLQNVAKTDKRKALVHHWGNSYLDIVKHRGV